MNVIDYTICLWAYCTLLLNNYMILCSEVQDLLKMAILQSLLLLEVRLTYSHSLTFVIVKITLSLLKIKRTI